MSTIEVIVNEHAQQVILENPKKLVPIVDTIKLCGHLGLYLRGHRDDSQYHPDIGSYSLGSVGNFVELLNFRVRAGDTTLEEHLKTCPKNASYVSKATQNELIKCCGQVICDKIVSDVKRNCFFLLLLMKNQIPQIRSNCLLYCVLLMMITTSGKILLSFYAVNGVCIVLI